MQTHFCKQTKTDMDAGFQLSMNENMEELNVTLSGKFPM